MPQLQTPICSCKKQRHQHPTHPFFFANLQTLKPQTLIDARLCLVFFFLSTDFADERGCKGEVDRVVSDFDLQILLSFALKQLAAREDSSYLCSILVILSFTVFWCMSRWNI